MVLATTGPRRVQTANRQNVGESERAVSAVVGGLFLASGVKRRGLSGLALALVGAELVRRGATGHCMLYDAIGFTSAAEDGLSNAQRLTRGATGPSRPDVRGAAATVNARKSIKIERTVRIARPSGELYEFWRDFQNLPRFLDHLESVTDLGGGRSHWVARGPGNSRIEWVAEIVNDIPGELIAWKTVNNPDVAHAGSVHFTPAGRGSEVRLVMDYEPPGGRIAAIASMFIGESPDEKIRDDLARLKRILEAGSSVAR